MTSLNELDDDRLANVLAAAALGMVTEVAAKDGLLSLRNGPDDEPQSFISLLASSVHAVRVLPFGDDEGHDEADVTDLPFSATDRDEISQMLRRLGAPDLDALDTP